MNENCRRALTVASCLAALLVVSCELMTAGQQGSEAEATSKLSPARATYDLEDEGLKVYWQQELGQLSEGKSLRSILAANPFLVVETDDDIVHCLDAESGIWKGTAALPAKVELPPVSVGTSIFFVCKNALFAFDVLRDDLSAPYHPGFALFSKPAVYGDRLIFGGGGGRLEAIDQSGDSQEWLASLSGEVFEQPVISGDVLYASANGDMVLAWDLAEEQELGRWGPPSPSELSSGVAVYNNSRIFVGDNRGIVYGLTTDFFQNVWQTMLEAPVIGKPEVIGDKLFVFTSEPALVCFSASEQTKLWKLAGATQLLTVGNRGLYVLSEGNVLSAVSPDTGETIWSDVLPKRCQVIGDPMAPVLYLANGAGSILAVKELD